MQQTMRNNNIGTTSKDTKGELEAGQDLPGGGIKNLPRGELELDGEGENDRRKPARLHLSSGERTLVKESDTKQVRKIRRRGLPLKTHLV